MSSEESGVPQPPNIQKKYQFSRVQLIGVPFLILIPLLALLGLFGESFATTNATGDALAMELDYPSRYRYKMVNPLVVSVQNVSSQMVPTVTVSFDQDYISGFSTVSFKPSLSEVTDEAYYVQLSDVQAGEVRQIVVDLQAERYWTHEGVIAATAGDKDAPTDVQTNVSTFVFP